MSIASFVRMSYFSLVEIFFLDRDIVICKEITKFYEEFFRCKVSDLKPFKNLKGEITIVISELNNKIFESKVTIILIKAAIEVDDTWIIGSRPGNGLSPRLSTVMGRRRDIVLTRD